MSKPFVVGLTGPAGSGKDTVADLLVAHAGFVKLAFAGPLRTEIASAFGIDPHFLAQRETKEHPISCLALRRCLSNGFVGRIGNLHSLAGHTLDLDAPRSPRQIMQWWGTDYRRHFQPSYWINTTASRIAWMLQHRPAQRIVLSDVRFADEAALVRSHPHSQLWQISRTGTEVAPGSHLSEVSGAGFSPDQLIDNSAGLGQLEERVLDAWRAGSTSGIDAEGLAA